MKSKEELNALKEEVETVRRKLRELTEDELKQISGGNFVKLANCDNITTFGSQYLFDCYTKDEQYQLRSW